MKKIYLNGKKMIEIENTHKYLKRKFMLDNYYGENLDALWDLLSERKENIQVIISSSADTLINLGDYGKSLLNLFKDLENVDLILK